MLIPSNDHVFLRFHRVWNHNGNEKTNIRKVKIVPIKEIFSLSNPISRIGKARIHPHIYKNGINVIVDNNFGPEKNSFRNIFFMFLKLFFILQYLALY